MKKRAFIDFIKKSFVIFCCSVSIFLPSAVSANSVAVGKTEQGVTPIYSYKKYDIVLKNAVFEDDCRDDGRVLTDRKYSSIMPSKDEINKDGWVGIKSYNGSADYRVTITLDLGVKVKDLSVFYTRVFHCPEITAAAPSSIKFYASSNGKDYTYVGDGKTVTTLGDTAASAVYIFYANNGFDGRYIKTVMECSGEGILYINEVGAAASGNVFRSNSNSNDIITDDQGVRYKINGSTAEVLGFASASNGKGGIITPSSASFDENGLKYTLGKGSNNEVEVISDFIGPGRPNYSGVPNNIKYIVIHNTGTTESDTDAQRYNHRMHSTDGESSWHYTVDSNVIYHSLSDNVVGWHAGATHNYESLGIEICTNGAPRRSSGAFVFSGDSYNKWVESTFRPALKNAAMLTAELLTRYGLGTDCVIQHYDVTEKNCPLWLRYKDGKYVHDGTLWIEFMGYVNEYYKLLNGDTPSPKIMLKRDITIPDYIATSDGFVFPVSTVVAGAFMDTGEILKTAVIGKNVTQIAANAFDGCDVLKVFVDSENEHFTSDESGALYDLEGNVIFDPDEVTSLPPAPKDGCILDIRVINGRNYIFCKDEQYTLSEIANLYGASNFSAINTDGVYVSEADVISTGALIRLDGVRFYLVAMGDLNGDTVVDAFDCLILKRAYLGKYAATQSQILAGAISDGIELNPFDYLMLKSHVFGKYNIFE